MPEEKERNQATSQEAGGHRRECQRLHAAYEAARAELNEKTYFAMLDAFALELAADAYGYEPVAAENVEPMRKGGAIKWRVVETPKGRMLALYTSRGQVEKFESAASVGIALRAFVKMAMGAENITGILVNPEDGHHGIPVEKVNLQAVINKSATAGRMPQLNPAVISNVCFRLWEVAVGVPTPVYDAGEEMKSLGGPEDILKPLLEEWNDRVKSGKYQPATPEAYVRDVLKDVIERSFVQGVFVMKDVEMAKTAEPAECLEKTPDLAGDIRQNLDEYLILLADTIRAGTGERRDEVIWAILAANVGVVAFGAMAFGFGWGVAKYYETLGPLELAGLRDRQQARYAKMKGLEKGKEEEDEEETA